MYAAFAGTTTDQAAVPDRSADVAARVTVPIAPVTLTPASVPVSPEIGNPAAFSDPARLLVSRMGECLRTGAGHGCRRGSRQPVRRRGRDVPALMVRGHLGDAAQPKRMLRANEP